MNPQITACVDLYSESLGFRSQAFALAVSWAYHRGLITRQEEADILAELGYPEIANMLKRLRQGF